MEDFFEELFEDLLDSKGIGCVGKVIVAAVIVVLLIVLL